MPVDPAHMGRSNPIRDAMQERHRHRRPRPSPDNTKAEALSLLPPDSTTRSLVE